MKDVILAIFLVLLMIACIYVGLMFNVNFSEVTG